MSLRGGRIERDDDTRSLRGQRRDSLRRREEANFDRGSRRNRRFDDTASERGGGLRRAEDTFSERGTARRRQDELLTDDRFRRRDEDTFSERGERRMSETKYRDDDSWERSSKKSDKSDKKYHSESSWEKQIDKRKDKYLNENDSDKKLRSSFNKKQDRLQEPFKRKDDRKGGLSPTKSSETISSAMSSTSGEDRMKGSKRDTMQSDTGQQFAHEPYGMQTDIQNDVGNEALQDNLLNDKETEEDEELDDDMKPLGAIPTTEWECQHCTYVNRPGSRVCEVCCKTRTADAESSAPAPVKTSVSRNNITEAKSVVKAKEEVREVQKVMASELPRPKPQEPEKKKGRRRTISFWIGTKLYS